MNCLQIQINKFEMIHSRISLTTQGNVCSKSIVPRETWEQNGSEAFIKKTCHVLI